MDIVEQMRSFESDHEPDGWPAVTMGQISALCDEIERLQSIIDEANAQEPLAKSYKNSSTGTGIDFLVINEMPEGETELYARPIPAQQSVGRDTIINVLLSIGNMSEGIIADAIISAIGAQQSPAVAVPDSPAVEHAWARFQAAINNDEPESSRTQFHAWADEKGFCMDEVWSSVGEPFESEDTQLAWEVWQASRSVLDTPSPRITEQDALPDGYREEWKRNVMLMWSCVRKHDSSIPSDVLDYMREQLLNKLNEAKHD